MKPDRRLLGNLNKLRELFGAPIIVNSAARCEIHNRKSGGSPRSQHLQGKAADITTRDWTETDRARLTFLAAFAGFRVVGQYDTFVHVDFRAADPPFVFEMR